MVIYVDPGAGAVGEAASRFGQAVGERLTEKQRREKALRENPAQMQALAQAYRAANEAGQGNTFLEGIGVRPEFGPQILAFQPTNAERYDVASGKLGGPEVKAGAEAAGLTVERDTALAQTERDVPRMMVDNYVTKTLYDTDSIQALRDLGVHTLSANTQAKVLGAQGAEAVHQGEYFDILNNNGFAQVRADAERSKAMLGLKTDSFQGSQIDTYVDNINRIDQSTPQGRKMALMANAFIANPGFANYLAEDEFIRLRASFSSAAQGDPWGAVKFGFELKDNAEKILGQMREVQASKLSSAEKRGQLEALGLDYQDVRDTYTDLTNAGVPLPQMSFGSFDLEKRMVTGEQFQADLASLGIFDPNDPERETYAKTLLSDSFTNEERLAKLQEHLRNLEPVSRSLGLSQKEQQAFGGFLTKTISDINEVMRDEARANPSGVMTRPGGTEFNEVLRRTWDLINRLSAPPGSNVQRELATPRPGGR